jgi:hypothetical protein
MEIGLESRSCAQVLPLSGSADCGMGTKLGTMMLCPLPPERFESSRAGAAGGGGGRAERW